MKVSLAVGAFLTALVAASFVPAQADDIIVVDHQGARADQTWQPAWDRFDFDRRHVMIGTVVKFEPFRLQLARRDGKVQTIDLKNGTVILPTGTTPMINERVAVMGYYSRGTFIANRVIVHG